MPTDVSQWETGWRITDRIRVHFWVLWQYPRFAMSLCNANIIMCYLTKALGSVCYIFHTEHHSDIAEECPGQTAQLSRCFLPFDWSRLKCKQDSMAPHCLLQADICVLLLVCSSSDKVLTQAQSAFMKSSLQYHQRIYNHISLLCCI